MTALARTRILAKRALSEPLALLAVPPFDGPITRHGDLVPLGLVLLALEDAGLTADAAQVREYLLSRRVRGLWSYHSGALETSIDSALVLLGVMDVEPIEELERFNVGEGRYIPQLVSERGDPGTMPRLDELAHWCQPDFSIACLVRRLRRRAGLPERTPASVLEQGFSTRSGLYFANPYFVDWLLAGALDETSPLRERLATEVLASASADGTFGQFDVVLSTALAVLTLAELGVDVGDYQRSLAQLAADRAAAATPFYSTEATEWSRVEKWQLLAAMTGDGRDQLIRVGCNEHEHLITWYRDTDGLVVDPLVSMALRDRGDDHGPALSMAADAPPHARYSCTTHADYIAQHALVPYL